MKKGRASKLSAKDRLSERTEIHAETQRIVRGSLFVVCCFVVVCSPDSTE